MTIRRVRLGLGGLAIVLLLGAAACSSGTSTASGGSSGAAASSSTPQHGGTLTWVDVTATWPTLDPANNGLALEDIYEYNLIYGQLFEFGLHDQIIPDLASGYRWLNNHMTLQITIRKGVTFSNGDPFTAANVAWSIKRDLADPKCQCVGTFYAVKSVTSSGDNVLMNFKFPDSGIFGSFWFGAPNWVVDQKALEKMGAAAYSQHPIGAGPFTVQQNQPNTQLVLVKNTKYWQPGHPYLDAVRYVAVQDDQQAFNEVLSNKDAGAAVLSASTAHQAVGNPNLNLVLGPGYGFAFVQFNTLKGPLANIKARQALMYATDGPAISKALDYGLFDPTQGPTGQGEAYYYGSHVPGYPGYDLAKAKALVKQIGGLSIGLLTSATNAATVAQAEALQKQWEAAGIKVTLTTAGLTEAHQITATGKFDAFMDTYGSIDPSSTLSLWFSSQGYFSHIKDPVLDGIINQAAQSFTPAQAKALYLKAAERIAQQAEMDFLFQEHAFYTLNKTIEWLPQYYHDYGQIEWENIWLNKSAS
jgi:peptide/nickel transport system substrate-binding protein